VKVCNDILLELDENKCVYLVLLDLSAAFDTIDHAVFLNRLKNDNHITGEALAWMESYLSNRHQRVNINSTSSDDKDILYGFPQGSLIGPFGFKLYTKNLTQIAKKHGINIHLYADDTQLYTSFDPEKSAEAMERLEACIEEIRTWMNDNFLKLNEQKTEFIIFGTQNNIDKVSEWSVSVGDSEVLPVKSVRNIGAMLDYDFKLNAHVIATTKSCYAHLHYISKIRKYLSIDAAKTLVHAFVTSRLDNLNSILAHPYQYQIDRLQKVQNNAARLILKVKMTDDITPSLISLHWLPVPQRIEFKILVLMFNCIYGNAPSYLKALIIPYVQNHYNLRSNTNKNYCVDSTNKRYGDRAFSNKGPSLWNELPMPLKMCKTLKSFKDNLKTHLFKIAYDC
jgi:hypothetical protein